MERNKVLKCNVHSVDVKEFRKAVIPSVANCSMTVRGIPAHVQVAFVITE